MEHTKQSIIHTIYKNKGFMDIYGGSLFITIMTCIIFFIAISYFYTMTHIKPIKKNWVQERCNPSVIPFAGLINKDPSTTTLEFTGQNFTSCVNNILINIVQDVLKPIHYAMSSVEHMGSGLMNDVNMIRKKIADVLGEFASIDTQIMGRILNFLMPVHLMMSKMMTIMKKSQATLLTGFYNVIGGYLGLNAFVGAFIDILIIFLVMLASLILPLLFFFFTIPLAIPPLLVFAVVAAYTTVVVVGLSDVLHMTRSSVPPKPRCFDGNTVLYDMSNNPIQIKDIQIGTVLNDGSTVTSTFILSSYQMEMFFYNGVIVSGNHFVKIGNKLMNVKELEHSIKIEDYTHAFIYCINTSSKMIHINDTLFLDWDSLDDNDFMSLRMQCKTYIPTIFKYNHIHEYLVGGFDKSTMIELDNGQSISIKDIEVNDVLRFGERVLGKVIIDACSTSVKKYTIGKQTYTCGPNNIVYDNELGVHTLLDMNGTHVKEDITQLYHLITDTDYITIQGIQFLDYDGSLEHFLREQEVVFYIS